MQTILTKIDGMNNDTKTIIVFFTVVFFIATVLHFLTDIKYR